MCETGKAVLIADYSTDTQCEPVPNCNVGSFLCVPLLSNDKALGTVNLVNGSGARRHFSETDRLAMTQIASLAGTAIENAILHRDLLEKEAIEANLKIAQSIQEGMYPTRTLDLPGYDVAWVNESCDETGGDYFDFITMPDGRLALSIGDVSGHGIGAAILMATGRANLRALLSVKSDLKEVMERLNNLLESDMDMEKFMTLFLGILDCQTGELIYVNAGHDCPLLYIRENDSIEEFQTSGIPIGMFPNWSYDSVHYARRLGPGDTLLLTTDGLWEAVGHNGDRYGKERLKKVFRESVELDAAAMVERVMNDVHEFCGPVQAKDDMTLVVVKNNAAGSPQVRVEDAEPA